MAPFDYAKFVSEMTGSDTGWAAPLEASLKGKLFLCALWMEALLAVKMVRGNGTRLRMEPLPSSRDGFLLELSRDCWISFHLVPANSTTVEIKSIGCHMGFDHVIVSPEQMDKMRDVARDEIKAAIAVLVS
jgi:hypothetical protein